MHGKKNIMVCVTQQKTCERLIKRGALIRKYLKDAELFVFHVVTSNGKFLNSDSESSALEYLFSVTKAENGNMIVERSEDLFDSIVKFVEKNKIGQIVIGESDENGEGNDSEEESFIHKLEEALPNVSINIVERAYQE